MYQSAVTPHTHMDQDAIDHPGEQQVADQIVSVVPCRDASAGVIAGGILAPWEIPDSWHDN
jgi:hypothetical protein